MKYLKFFFHFVLIAILGLLTLIFATQVIIKPSNDREWTTDQQVLAHADINANLVTIHNIRNFQYRTVDDYTPNYYDRVFDLDKIKKVWYVVEPFSGVPGSAHTFLSFEFEGNQFVAISVEIRKENGEKYNPIKGLFNQYELMYVIADERDVIKLRTNYRKDLVYLYPAKTTKEKMQQLFLDMVARANHLKDHAEFYNTITNTCTTNIVRHVNAISPERIPKFRWQILFPRESDRLAYRLGLIDTNLPLEKARERYLINKRAIKYAEDYDFSVKIRGDD
jgi:hypothetical protein